MKVSVVQSASGTISISQDIYSTFTGHPLKDLCTPYESVCSVPACVCVFECVRNTWRTVHWWMCHWTIDPSSLSVALTQPACSTPLIRVASPDRNPVTIRLLTNGTRPFVTPISETCEKLERWHILAISVHLVPFLPLSFPSFTVAACDQLWGRVDIKARSIAPAVVISGENGTKPLPWDFTFNCTVH